MSLRQLKGLKNLSVKDNNNDSLTETNPLLDTCYTVIINWHNLEFYKNNPKLNEKTNGLLYLGTYSQIKPNKKSTSLIEIKIFCTELFNW